MLSGSSTGSPGEPSDATLQLGLQRRLETGWLGGDLLALLAEALLHVLLDLDDLQRTAVER
jgi:hypothetical protein